MKLDLESVLVGAALAGKETLDRLPEKWVTPEIQAAVNALRGGNREPMRQLLRVPEGGLLDGMIGKLVTQVTEARLRSIGQELRMLAGAPEDDWKRSRMKNLNEELKGLQ